MFEDTLESSWYYQEVIEKGINIGEQKGIEEGEVKAMRSMLIRVAQTHFPELLPLARQEAERSATVAALNAKVDKLLLAKTPDEARQALQES